MMKKERSKIILYHGTDERIIRPRVDKGKIKNDFGRGFYLTPDIKQAKGMAKRRYKRNYFLKKDSKMYLYKYQLDLEGAKKALKFLRFKADSNWAKFVLTNRTSYISSNTDIIIGPTADGALVNTLFLWKNGSISTEVALDKLKPDIYSLQYCLKTNKALMYLKYLSKENLN